MPSKSTAHAEGQLATHRRPEQSQIACPSVFNKTNSISPISTRTSISNFSSTLSYGRPPNHSTASSSSRAPSDSCPKFEYRKLATGRPMPLSFFRKIHQCRSGRTRIEPSNCRIHMVCIANQLLWSRRRQTQPAEARHPSTLGYATAQ